MDSAEHRKEKVYYSMGEVSEMMDISATTIRFWESKFDILRPHKNKKGNRLFTPADVDNLKLIYHLVKERGMTLAGARKRLGEDRDAARRDMEIADRLLSIRSLLVEIREELKTGGGEVVWADEYSEPTIPDSASVSEFSTEAAADVEEPIAEPEPAAEDVAADMEPPVEVSVETDWLSGMSTDVEFTAEPGSLFGLPTAPADETEGCAEISPAEMQEEPRRPMIIEQTLF